MLCASQFLTSFQMFWHHKLLTATKLLEKHCSKAPCSPQQWGHTFISTLLLLSNFDTENWTGYSNVNHLLLSNPTKLQPVSEKYLKSSKPHNSKVIFHQAVCHSSAACLWGRTIRLQRISKDQNHREDWRVRTGSCVQLQVRSTSHTYITADLMTCTTNTHENSTNVGYSATHKAEFRFYRHKPY